MAPFNPFNPEDVDDPYASYADLRAHCPVLKVAPGVAYLSRHESVTLALGDRDRFSSRGGLSLNQDASDALPGETTINATDRPEHTRLRKMLRTALSPRLVASNEVFVVGAARELVADFVEAGQADLMSELAFKLPARSILRMIGVPDDDYEKVHDWTEELERAVDPAKGVALSDFYTGRLRHPAAESFFDYVQGLIEERRAATDPPDDLVTRMVRHRDDEDGSSFTDRAIVIQVTFLLIAGNDTTSHLIGNLLHDMALDPALFQAVRDNRGLLSAAIEESLRKDSPVQILMRCPIEDVEVDGTVLPAGSKVVTGLGSANRDETVYYRADEFDLGRERTSPHVAFGVGAHLCIGAPLARLEAKAAVNALLDRIESLEIAPGYRYERVRQFAHMAPKTLLVRFSTTQV